jgi:hypothetical protein
MDIVHIDKCRYGIQDQEVAVRYTGIYRSISSTGYRLQKYTGLHKFGNIGKRYSSNLTVHTVKER